ncbi:MAG: hypothetical protein AB8G22_15320 [Saprospiraceae bacterium]
MEQKIKSEGHCIYCSDKYSKRGMSRHIETHLKQLAKEAKSGKQKTVPAFHVRVEAWEYFLQLLVNGEKPLDDLDSFLRQIWLECCGHMSSIMDKNRLEYGMGILTKKLFKKGDTLKHIYDWGSTTECTIKVISEHRIPMEESIRLLSRNEPLAIPCDSCGKNPAVEMCTVHGWDEDFRFCGRCGNKHRKKCSDAADYSMMDFFNSPRTGVCAYEGGQIDLKRDVLQG